MTTPYSETFEKSLDLDHFITSIKNDLAMFEANMIRVNYNKNNSLADWITIFLQWCEYTDYMEDKESGG